MILILVEHPVRELDIAIALKNRLAIKGVVVDIVSINFNYKWLYNINKYKIVIFPSLQWKIINWIDFLYKGIIFSLNYEQMLSNANKILKPIEGTFLKLEVFHISWTKEYSKHLIFNGVCSKNIFLINKPSLELFYTLKNNQFILNLKLRYKKLIFIPLTDLQAFKTDSFLSNEFVNQDLYLLALNRRDYVKRTLKDILGWILEACNQFSDFVFVLRPHPSVSPKQYDELFNEFKVSAPINLYVTSEFNAVEWIQQSDLIFSNYSSLLNDAHEYGKSCFILEPQKLPEYLYLDWMINIEKVKSIESFISIISSNVIDLKSGISINRFNGIAQLSSLILNKYLISTAEKKTFRFKIINLFFLFSFFVKVFAKKIIYKFKKSLLRPGLQIDYFKDL